MFRSRFVLLAFVPSSSAAVFAQAAPYQALFARMTSIMDRIEAILARRG